MKKHIMVSVSEDLLERAKTLGLNISQTANNALYDAVNKPIKALNFNVKELRCVWCEKMILDDFYYICEFHGNVFCEDCAKNHGKSEINARDAPRCKFVNKRIDCIYKRKEIVLHEQS